MKADNEPATNDILQVCQKMKICLKKAKQNKTTKKREKKSNHGPSTGEVNALSIAPQQPMLNRAAKFIIFKIFCP